jgi:chorismate-pyruvate lyase
MNDWDGPRGTIGDPTSEGSVASAPRPTDELARRHFVLQAHQPTHFGDVELAKMDPLLRGILFTDGTVTRALEVQALSRVSVEVVDQTDTSANGEVAEYLKVPGGTKSVRRRVLIGTEGSTKPAIWAESHILPSRLPAEFLSVLRRAPDGIGESLQQVELESYREMLWFGADLHPAWSNVNPDGLSSVITRLYRVITAGLPAFLISESFSVGQDNGTYRLNYMD